MSLSSNEQVIRNRGKNDSENNNGEEDKDDMKDIIDKIIKNGPFLRKEEKEDDGECVEKCAQWSNKHCYKCVLCFTILLFLNGLYLSHFHHFSSTTLGIVLIIFCLTITSFMFISFIKAVITKPLSGSIENPDCTEQEKNEAIERSVTAKKYHLHCVDFHYPVRYCTECKMFRLPRSYHCKKCKRCVLERDHHCKFLGNCIGKNNFKYFYLYILYTVLSLIISFCLHLYSIILIISTLIHYGEYNIRLSLYQTIKFCGIGGFDVVIIMITILLLISMCNLLYVYTKLMLQNMTALEEIEYDRSDYLYEESQIPNHDEGVVNNIKHFMGPLRTALLPF